MAAQLAALALLLRSLVLAAGCAPGLGFPTHSTKETGDPAILALLAPAAYNVICHGAAAYDAPDRSSKHSSGENGQSSSCCGDCCMPFLPAAPAAFPVPRPDGEPLAAKRPDSVRLAGRETIRNRGPPAQPLPR